VAATAEARASIVKCGENRGAAEYDGTSGWRISDR
jgi:hypothetical protein